jgi:hypothetical protein
MTVLGAGVPAVLWFPKPTCPSVQSHLRSWPKCLAISSLGCIAVVLTACTVPRTIATFQTTDGTISLQETRNDSYSVRVDPGTSLPLDRYTSARIESVWNLSGARLIVIGGASSDCQQRYTLVIAATDTASLHSIGDCGDTYSFALHDSTLTIRQTGVRDPKLWTFKDGMLDGPTVQIARPSRPPARATTARPGENDSDATSLPPVSAPVGDEVIPSPVGGSGSGVGQPNAIPRP